MEKQPKIQLDPPNPDVVALLTRLGITSNLFQAIMERRLAREGLTLAQLSVLSHLIRMRTPQRVTDIARRVEVSQPAVTKIFAKFEGAGLITFTGDERDRRTKAAKITQKGAERFFAAQRSAFPELGAFIADWSPEDRAEFMHHLERLSTFLDHTRTLDAAATKGETHAK